LALAQPRAYFPWWEGRLSDEVNLSQEQRAKIRDVQREYRDEMIDQRADLEKAEARFADLLASEDISDAEAEAAVAELVAARGAVTRSLTEMSIELRRVLTTEQWRELQSRRGDWMERRERLLERRNPTPRRGPSSGPPPNGGPPPPGPPGSGLPF
jgi:Spy/CpxP family protein refolding chaperone